MLKKRVRQGARAPQKHSAIPEVISSFDELGGARRVRFFGEAPHLKSVVPDLKRRTGFDVSVAGLCAGWGGCRARQCSRPRQRSRFQFSRPPDMLFVADHMVGRETVREQPLVGIQQMNAASPIAGAVLRPDWLGENLILAEARQLAHDLTLQMLVGDDPEPRREASGSRRAPSAESWCVFRQAPEVALPGAGG